MRVGSLEAPKIATEITTLATTDDPEGIDVALSRYRTALTRGVTIASARSPRHSPEEPWNQVISSSTPLIGISETPIQGTASDIVKIAMIRVADALKKEKLETKMIMQVHDELVLEVQRDAIEEVSTAVRDYMVDAAALKVDYTFAEYVKIEGMTKGAVILELHLEGLNEADSGKPVILDAYRAVRDSLVKQIKMRFDN